MEVADVPPALQARLGVDATTGLLALFETARREWTADMTVAAVERFERRLTEESASLRVGQARGEAALGGQIKDLDVSLRSEMNTMDGALRDEIKDLGVALRSEMSAMDAALRGEIEKLGTALRGEMRTMDRELRGEIHALDSSLRQAIHGQGVAIRKEISDLVRWNFAFWVGQVVATAGIIGVMLQLMRP